MTLVDGESEASDVATVLSYTISNYRQPNASYYDLCLSFCLFIYNLKLMVKMVDRKYQLQFVAKGTGL